MSQTIISINAGSSSVKVTLFKTVEDDAKIRELATANVAGVGSPPAKLTYSRADHKSITDLPKDATSHDDAFKCLLQAFVDDKGLTDVLKKEDIAYTCHRVVHGGDYKEYVVITDETYHHIENLEDLAPLHNASALAIIRSCLKEMPNAENIACFDSAFHQTMPDHVKTYMIDPKTSQEKGLRKYGFHGVSYSYILRAVAKYLGKQPSETNLIACHLGSGASICAIKNGKSLDTTMGLTPVSGLPGGSRSGDIDPSLIFHFTSTAAKLSPHSTEEIHITTAEEILNKQSGWKAVTGTTDFSQIAKEDAPESHQLAFNIFLDRIVGYIGNYFVKLEGQVDALVFAGGIGERSALLRKRVVDKCRCLGCEIDDEKNAKPGDDSVFAIGTSGKLKTLICSTDEQYEMAYTSITHPPTDTSANLM